jgi:hypothetical protein
MVNNWQVVETDQFKEEAERLFDSGTNDIRTALVWALERGPLSGQKLAGRDQWIWVIFRGNFAYLAYYSMSGHTVKLESVVKRQTPVAPGPLGLES